MESASYLIEELVMRSFKEEYEFRLQECIIVESRLLALAPPSAPPTVSPRLAARERIFLQFCAESRIIL
ncbi:hypothetical protein Y032_0017g3340 [Ancylostoma ceylanicum]|uniref:Uncharacterized protein n=1 Tax=Ancylostoma ceylanicum TaxID=53326 RepID=A0A016V6R5_9BILA|nr:hypothetical protein Y032_0017g3340 [Ancylostoma ceylanicum]